MLALSINWVRMEYQLGDNLTTLLVWVNGFCAV